MIGRLVQGVGGGLLIPQISGMIQQLFRGAERGKAFGLLGSTIGISTAVGPLLGGLLIQGFGASEGWRWVFFVNLPIGVLALLPGRAPGARRLRGGTTARGGSPSTRSVSCCWVPGVLAVMLPLVEEPPVAGAGQVAAGAGGGRC